MKSRRRLLVGVLAGLVALAVLVVAGITLFGDRTPPTTSTTADPVEVPVTPENTVLTSAVTYAGQAPVRDLWPGGPGFLVTEGADADTPVLRGVEAASGTALWSWSRESTDLDVHVTPDGRTALLLTTTTDGDRGITVLDALTGAVTWEIAPGAAAPVDTDLSRALSAAEAPLTVRALADSTGYLEIGGAPSGDEPAGEAAEVTRLHVDLTNGRVLGSFDDTLEDATETAQVHVVAGQGAGADGNAAEGTGGQGASTAAGSPAPAREFRDPGTGEVLARVDLEEIGLPASTGLMWTHFGALAVPVKAERPVCDTAGVRTAAVIRRENPLRTGTGGGGIAPNLGLGLPTIDEVVVVADDGALVAHAKCGSGGVLAGTTGNTVLQIDPPASTIDPVRKIRLYQRETDRQVTDAPALASVPECAPADTGYWCLSAPDDPATDGQVLVWIGDDGQVSTTELGAVSGLDAGGLADLRVTGGAVLARDTDGGVVVLQP
ncbi:hypothetical protein [Brevibacterium litoralis]|uniref:hypothetical protein n=1 Tax=Brevibacterium litoralis TaxID=3138935 RepID=UPI0032EDDE42